MSDEEGDFLYTSDDEDDEATASQTIGFRRSERVNGRIVDSVLAETGEFAEILQRAKNAIITSDSDQG